MRASLAAALVAFLPTAAAIFFASTPREIISAAQAHMQATPANLVTQRNSCVQLMLLVNQHREEPGPFGGFKVATSLLDAGIGEAFATGLANAVGIDVAMGRTSPGMASNMCINGIFTLVVQNDYEKGLHLIQNSPDLWPAIVSYFRAFSGDRAVLDRVVMLAGLFGTPQPPEAVCGLVEAGGMDLVLELMDDKDRMVSDPALFQGLLAALSDNVQAHRCAALAIANHGGHLQGIELMVQALSWTRESDVNFHEGNGFGLLYECVHDTKGVLRHDDANLTFMKAFVQAGYLEQLVPVMELQPQDALLQQNGCDAITIIAEGDSAARARLVELGAAEHIARELKQGFCTIGGACSVALHKLGGTLDESAFQAGSSEC